MEEILFGSNVTKITDDDFTLNETIKLNLKNIKVCCLVLFYDSNICSREMAKIWNKISSQVAGSLFLSCDLMQSKQVAITMRNYQQNPSQEWINLTKIPLILVYTNGVPKGVYNDIYEEGPLLRFVADFACTRELEREIKPNTFCSPK